MGDALRRRGHQTLRSSQCINVKGKGVNFFRRALSHISSSLLTQNVTAVVALVNELLAEEASVNPDRQTNLRQVAEFARHIPDDPRYNVSTDKQPEDMREHEVMRLLLTVGLHLAGVVRFCEVNLLLSSRLSTSSRPSTAATAMHASGSWRYD